MSSNINPNSFITIPSSLLELAEEHDLSFRDMGILAVINGFSQDGDSWFYGSISYLQTWTRTKSKATIQSSLSRLLDIGLIEKDTIDLHGVSKPRYRISKIGRGGQKLVGGVPKIDPYNIEDNNAVTTSEPSIEHIGLTPSCSMSDSSCVPAARTHAREGESRERWSREWGMMTDYERAICSEAAIHDFALEEQIFPEDLLFACRCFGLCRINLRSVEKFMSDKEIIPQSDLRSIMVKLAKWDEVQVYDSQDAKTNIELDARLSQFLNRHMVRWHLIDSDGLALSDYGSKETWSYRRRETWSSIILESMEYGENRDPYDPDAICDTAGYTSPMGDILGT